MRAHGNEGRLGRRFAIVIGVAAAGVMALGVQTATSTTGPVDSTPPDLELSGPKKIGPECADGASLDRCGAPRAVHVIASCGEAFGPPVSSVEHPGDPPANLPDLGCHLSAEGKVMGDKLRHGLQARVDLPGPGVRCSGPPPLHCYWASGSRALMELELRKKTLIQAGKALAEGKKVKAKVTVNATDAAGNVATAKRTIRLVKRCRGRRGCF